MQIGYKRVTITSGTSLSDSIEVGDGVLMGIHMPAAWTAAGMTFQGSQFGTTFDDVYKDNGDGTLTEVNIGVSASKFITALDPTIFGAFSFLKIRSGVTALAVNQAADRTILLLFR